MIVFHTPEARDCCRTVIREAKQRGLLQQLVEKLIYLAHYSNRPGGYYAKDSGADTRCFLWRDSPELSFNFLMQRRVAGDTEWQTWFHGGLVFHGGHWGIHT